MNIFDPEKHLGWTCERCGNVIEERLVPVSDLGSRLNKHIRKVSCFGCMTGPLITGPRD